MEHSANAINEWPIKIQTRPISRFVKPTSIIKLIDSRMTDL